MVNLNSFQNNLNLSFKYVHKDIDKLKENFKLVELKIESLKKQESLLKDRISNIKTFFKNLSDVSQVPLGNLDKISKKKKLVFYDVQAKKRFESNEYKEVIKNKTLFGVAKSPYGNYYCYRIIKRVK